MQHEQAAQHTTHAAGSKVILGGPGLLGGGKIIFFLSFSLLFLIGQSDSPQPALPRHLSPQPASSGVSFQEGARMRAEGVVEG